MKAGLLQSCRIRKANIEHHRIHMFGTKNLERCIDRIGLMRHEAHQRQGRAHRRAKRGFIFHDENSCAGCHRLREVSVMQPRRYDSRAC